MICDQFQENLELYALGALESGEAQALADHLATGCAACREALQCALDQNLAVSSTVPLVEPPRRLRRRVKETITPSANSRPQWFPWGLLAAVALLTVALDFTLQTRLQRQTDINEAQSVERARLTETLQIVRAPGTHEVSFTDPKLPGVHGAVYIHQRLGLALVIDRLPNAPPGWKYESWVVPKTGAPRPVERFHPDSKGGAVSVVPGPVEVADVAALAVSMEPENSHPTKPTTLVFAAKI